jgi:hypothetical protein
MEKHSITVDTNDIYPTLSWSAYEEWKQGVAVYELQVKSIKEKVKSGEAFGNLAYLPPSTRLSFTDSSTSLNGEFYCYRVIAYRHGDSIAIGVQCGLHSGCFQDICTQFLHPKWGWHQRHLLAKRFIRFRLQSSNL